MDNANALDRAIAAAEKDSAMTNDRLMAASLRLDKLRSPPQAQQLPLPQQAASSDGFVTPAKAVPVDEEEGEPLITPRMRASLFAFAVVVAAVVIAERWTVAVVNMPVDDAVSTTINQSDTCWMLTATALVLLMIPALGLFEAGLLRSKNSVSVLMQCFAGLGVLSTLWMVVGFSLCFSTIDNGLFGGLDHVFLASVHWASPLPNAPTIPGTLFALFQLMFAAITPLLCTGAFAERLRFEAFLVFIIVWSAIVYYPLCHWIWGGGWLAQLGVVDFAGGIVIHTAAGVASLVTSFKLGPRVGFDGLASMSLAPHNLPMAATGVGLLWVGWMGFNGGSALTSGALASSTVLGTHAAGSSASLAWLALDWIVIGRPTFVGVINGALSGLAGVTPASGFVTPSAGLVIGLLCGVGSYLGVLLFKERLRIDDALDVSSIHGVTGVMGSLLLGIYASSEVNPDGPDASLSLLGIQAIGVAVAIVWSGLGTWLVMSGLEMIMHTRAHSDEESRGLDHSQHGERSYLDLHALV